MSSFPEGNALIYCEGCFGTTNGKTAHGLIRRTRRYNILSVVDSKLAGKDAGMVLDGKKNGIPILSSIEEAFNLEKNQMKWPTHLVIGLAPDGGKLSITARNDVIKAINLGLNIDSGLHDFLSEDPKISKLANKKKVILRDIRKTPSRKNLHFFNGKIDEVNCLKIAILGTDSAIGKRTTAWILLEGLEMKGYKVELIGTGQTAWMQGAKYHIILDSLINDFVAGEIEHAIWSAWNETKPDIIIIEGQGSLMNPAYPGGFEILAAGRPDIVILQHAPARNDYDGFPGYKIQPIDIQIKAIELLSGKPVVAITINHEKLTKKGILQSCNQITKNTGLPTSDVLVSGPDKIIDVINPYIKRRKNNA